MDEFALIRLWTSRRNAGTVRQRPDVVVGIGDDAAVVRVREGYELVLSCDTMTESVHFLPETMEAADIGWKALAANVSDMAAMGAEPRWALIALSAPRQPELAERVAELYRGLYACAELYGVELVGGDTTSSRGGLTVTVTIAGEVERGRALLRSAARPGDAVFVTGPLGSSAAGLHALLAGGAVPPTLAAAHRRPMPRVDAGRLLAESGVCGALNDVSDGLASEAWEIAEASGVRLELEAPAIPLHDEARSYAGACGVDPLEWALYGGEDYELVGTVPEAEFAPLAERFASRGVRLHRVGRVLEGEGVGLIVRCGDIAVTLDKKGYNHFS